MKKRLKLSVINLLLTTRVVALHQERKQHPRAGKGEKKELNRKKPPLKNKSN